MSTLAPTAPAPETGFNCTSSVLCTTAVNSTAAQNEVLYGLSMGALIVLSTMFMSFWYDTGYSMFRQGWSAKKDPDLYEGEGRTGVNAFGTFVSAVLTIGLLSWTLPLYYETVTNGGSTTPILGWGNWNNGPTGPGGASVSLPFFMYPRDTVRWWSVIATAPAVIMGVLTHWAYGGKLPGPDVEDDWKRKWMSKMLVGLVIVGLTSSMVLPSGIAYQSAHFNHTDYNEIPYTYQAWRNLNFHFLDYTDLMLAAGILVGSSFLFYSVHHIVFRKQLLESEKSTLSQQKRTGAAKALLYPNDKYGYPEKNPLGVSGPAGLHYRNFGSRLFAGVVPAIPVSPTIMGAAFFTCFAAAFVYAGDQRLAILEALIIWGTPIVVTAAVGNLTYWAWYQVCAIFYGYLWVFWVAIVAGTQSESPISQKSINYALLVTSPVQLDFSFNQAWVGSQTTAYIAVGTAVALASASALNTLLRWRGMRWELNAVTKQVVNTVGGTQAEVRPLVR